LRRAANAVVSILAQSQFSPRMSTLVKTLKPPAAAEQTLLAFFRERLEFYLREVLGVSFDVVHAVLNADADDVAGAVARAKALSSVRDSEDFAAISAAFKRSKNILRQASEKALFSPDAQVQPALITDAAEQSLYTAAIELGPVVENLRAQKNYAAALEQIATLRPHVDHFFDKVMVMVEEEAIRTNRLALLALIVNEFSKIADFSEIVARGA
jgi:glycyl-tRNA synthetase beta chain